MPLTVQQFLADLSERQVRGVDNTIASESNDLTSYEDVIARFGSEKDTKGWQIVSRMFDSFADNRPKGPTGMPPSAKQGRFFEFLLDWWGEKHNEGKLPALNTVMTPQTEMSAELDGGVMSATIDALKKIAGRRGVYLPPRPDDSDETVEAELAAFGGSDGPPFSDVPEGDRTPAQKAARTKWFKVNSGDDEEPFG